MGGQPFNLRVGGRQVSFELFLVFLILGTHLFVVFAPINSLMPWYPTDDAYYYFKVARHIIAGDGVTFDGFNPANGFHPLWMVICIGVFSLGGGDLIVPLRVMVMVMAVLNAATAVLLFRLLKRFIRPVAAGLAALVWAFLPAIHQVTTQLGMESGLNAFAVVLLFLTIAEFEEKPALSLNWKDLCRLGLVAALALFSRLDNVFLVALAGLWVVFRAGGMRGYLLAYLLGEIVATVLSFFLRLGFTVYYYETMTTMVEYMFLGVVVRLAVYYGMGLHRPPSARINLRDLLRIFFATSLGTLASGLLVLGLSFLGLAKGFPRLVIPIEWGISLVMALVIRFLGRFLDQRKNEEIATGWEGVRLYGPQWIRAALSFGLPLALLLGGYLAWNQINFGTFMPVSGQIKQWWGAMNDTIYGRAITSFWGLFGLQDFHSGPWGLLWMPVQWLGGAGLGALYGIMWIFLWREIRPALGRSGFWLLLAACFLQVIYYNASYYVNFRAWYWVNQMLLVVIFWAVLLHGLLGVLEQFELPKKVIQPMAWIVACALILNYGIYQFDLVPLSQSARSPSPDINEAHRLEQLTEPGSRIGVTGGGAVAYFIQDRTIVNLDGLMNSNEYFQAVKAGKGRAVVDRFGLSYVFGDETILTKSDPYYFTLANRLEKIAPVGGGFLFRYVRGETK
jgi:hypothetical protein